MTIIDDMHRAERIVRAKPVERKLCCPRCRGEILLLDGYRCENTYRRSCEFTTDTLADLVAR